MTLVTSRDVASIQPPSVPVPDTAASPAPVKIIKSEDLQQLGNNLTMLFAQYRSDRVIAEQRWLRAQRQYLGYYDPDVEKAMQANRSRAYPRVTRIKCISVLSRLMSLMFPSDERNWELKASPSEDMSVADVTEAVQAAQAKDNDAGVEPDIDLEYIMSAVQQLSDDRAEALTHLIDDQLQELGGDQTYDYIALNREVIQSATIYGLGLMRGPYARKCSGVEWTSDGQGSYKPRKTTVYKPMYEFLKIWDFYPDMSAKTLDAMDGSFTRHVMTRAMVKDLGKREDFFAEQIDAYLTRQQVGNFRQQPFEMELRAMGVKINVNEQKIESTKYEVIVWHGRVSAGLLQMAGVEVSQDKLADDLEAEIWMIDTVVIKADLNPWVKLGVNVKTLHAFLFDTDDTSPIGFGIPSAIRDSQMSISAATRMLMDNASIVCGPQLEVNTDLLRGDQDLMSTGAYKIWYREGTGPESQWPAVRNVDIDSHIPDLQGIIKMFSEFADAETFVGPATGGDMSQAPSEPMRTAAGASMLRGDAALPFKDIVRSFDRFTQSVIYSMVRFNEKFNPKLAPGADFNVIARGATSLIAKEVRAMQVDQLAATLKPEEMLHVDERKLVEARFKARDMGNFLVPPDVVKRRQAQQDQAAAAQAALAQALQEANTRKLLADAYKNIAQGNKNIAGSDAVNVETALDIMERGANSAIANLANPQPQDPAQAAPGGGPAVPPQPQGGQPGDGGDPAGAGLPPGGGQGGAP